MKLAKGRTVTVGLPRALYHYYYPRLWETFLRELGVKVVLSRRSTARTLERACLISETEHCLPLKMLDAHIEDLLDRVDMIFVPRILSSLKGHISCPKLGALPDVARAQLGDRIEVLTVDVNESRVPLEKTLKALGKQLGADRKTIRAATEKALEALRQATDRQMRSRGNGDKPFLIVSHPYNLNDDFFSGPILRKLESMDVAFDVLRLDRKDIPPEPIRWDTCSKMHHALERLSPESCAGVLQISSFNCGCDSIVMQLFRPLLRAKGIPYMTLVLDAHTAQAGIDTRLEAFVDSTRWAV